MYSRRLCLSMWVASGEAGLTCDGHESIELCRVDAIVLVFVTLSKLHQTTTTTTTTTTQSENRKGESHRGRRRGRESVTEGDVTYQFCNFWVFHTASKCLQKATKLKTTYKMKSISSSSNNNNDNNKVNNNNDNNSRYAKKNNREQGPHRRLSDTYLLYLSAVVQIKHLHHFSPEVFFNVWRGADEANVNETKTKRY